MLKKYSAFILLILITSNVVVAEISHDFEIVFTEIRSLKKSSRVGYENDYLFVARVRDNFEVEKIMIRKGDLIEVLARRNICYDEAKMSFLSMRKTILTIKNVRVQKIVKANENKEYSWFLKIEAFKNDKVNSAGCIISNK